MKDPNVNTTYTGLLHKHQPSAEHHPCYSGLQVQGTANTPAARVLILSYFLVIVNGWGECYTVFEEVFDYEDIIGSHECKIYTFESGGV